MNVTELQINIQRTKQSRLPEIDFSNLPFGRIFTDHVLIADYNGTEWTDYRIEPYAAMDIMPALSAIHYGQSIFEGMKAHLSPEGNAYLFRPRDNQRRLNVSAQRMCMPELPEDIFMEGLKTLVSIDSGWIPQYPSALYIRPFMFATDACVGVRPSETYRFMIICCPVNPFYSEPMKVKAEETYSRAIEGGVGFAKAAGNYASSLLPTKLAQKEGFGQIMWLDGKEHKYLEESGTMNLFFVINGEIHTPELHGTILNGITRDSILTLAKDEKIKVNERRISIDELCEFAYNGRLTECFGTGTAASVLQFISFTYKGKEYQLPEINERKISNRLTERLNNIKSFKEEDKFGWMEKV